ncbi:MAG: UvrD-helicase domain-containing protein [Verrucomicrobiota bacterium]|nr:UvrD-helicase domain-containing protein [Limisphaera sp.]MDW8380686.1 UvrD-helicase domain-containing protein [Verrucomicrobiota bacterium]
MSPSLCNPEYVDSELTKNQALAVQAVGNVLVMAGAGTGKTRTLVERILHLLVPPQQAAAMAGHGTAPCRVTELLVVTFTEAAAAELRERIRLRLEDAVRSDSGTRWREQLALLDSSSIGTLHSFCYRLIADHFADLELDPRLTVIEEGQASLLQREVLEELLETILNSQGEQAAALRWAFLENFRADLARLREWVLRVHAFAQSLQNPAAWYDAQAALLSESSPKQWQNWLGHAFKFWYERWLGRLQEETKQGNRAAQLIDGILQHEQLTLAEPLSSSVDVQRWANVCASCLAEVDRAVKAKEVRKKDCASLGGCLDDLRYLHRLLHGDTGSASANRKALVVDWDRMRRPMLALLRLSQAFGNAYAAAKRQRGWLDFADLEQFALVLLWDHGRGQPTDLARRLRHRYRWIFVDEYQDINPAQDLILRALCRDEPLGNRFLVGDVKQSIYQFRRANPKIFRDYAEQWQTGTQKGVIFLRENFRSRPELLRFVNEVFSRLMHEEVGGVSYGQEARLEPGSPAPAVGGVTLKPAVEVWIWQPSERSLTVSASTEPTEAEDFQVDAWTQAEREARFVALRLRQLKRRHWLVRDPKTGLPRPVRFSDMAVLLRSPAPKTEIYVRQFEEAGVPLEVPQKGFFQSLPVSDLLNLLRLLDNPIQDLPLLAVLRSPLVGLSMDELAWICAQDRNLPVWQRMCRWTRRAEPDPECPIDTDGLRKVLQGFIHQHARWRQLARQRSVSACLEAILTETRYLDWIATRPEGRIHQMQLERCLELAREHDRIYGGGLHQFLDHLEAFDDCGAEPEVGLVGGSDAVRLLSIHQSKGLEFPVVVVADLSKPFNLQDLQSEVLVDEEYGLSAKIRTADGRQSYPSLSYWLARQRQWREKIGEEIRLMYVACTRARDYLLLTGQAPARMYETGSGRWDAARLLDARSSMDLYLPVFQELGLPAPQKDAQVLMGSTLHFQYGWLPAEQTEPPEDSITEEARPPAAIQSRTDQDSGVDWIQEALQRGCEGFTVSSYPHLAATQEPAKTTVTSVQHRWHEDPVLPWLVSTTIQRERRFPSPPLTALERGTAYHRFLRDFSLEIPPTVEAFRSEAHRLQQAGKLTRAEVEALDLNGLAAFWASDLGELLRKYRLAIRRELAFTLCMSASDLRQLLGRSADPSLAGERVVVQGAADLVVVLPQELWVLDFKTDQLQSVSIQSGIQRYRIQLCLYAHALETIYRRPVQRRWIHFLAVHQTVEVPDMIAEATVG